jgi:phosphoglycerate dehydrogenase-like enzyme
VTTVASWVGCGRIGRAVTERLQPFKTRILVTDPYVSSLIGFSSAQPMLST